MELTQVEMALVEKVVCENNAQLQELNELQLALVGGGGGDVVFA